MGGGGKQASTQAVGKQVGRRVSSKVSRQAGRQNRLGVMLSLIRLVLWRTLTRFVCPIRCERAMACTSFCGFQSESIMMHVSAAVRLIPRPAVVEGGGRGDFGQAPRALPPPLFDIHAVRALAFGSGP